MHLGMFSIQTVGVRPSYIDATRRERERERAIRYSIGIAFLAALFSLFPPCQVTKADDFHVRPEDIANQKKRTKADAGPQKVKFDQAYVKQPCSKLNFCAFVSWLSGTVMQDVYIYIYLHISIRAP